MAATRPQGLCILPQAPWLVAPPFPGPGVDALASVGLSAGTRVGLAQSFLNNPSLRSEFQSLTADFIHLNKGLLLFSFIKIENRFLRNYQRAVILATHLRT